MTTNHPIVIVGAGQAGIQAALAARQEGFEGEIIVVGAEAELPYQRPPLSKAYLTGEVVADRFRLRPAPMYEKARVTLRLGLNVVGIDREQRLITLSNAEELRYARLVLATGGRPRELALDGLDASPPANLHYLRTIADVDAMRQYLEEGSRLAVIGGGFLGLEVAASARKLGLEVTVLEAMPQILARVAPPVIADFYAAEHRRQGVDVLTQVMVKGAELDAAGNVAALHCENGTRIDADVVLVAIGICPNVELAAQCGLETDDGIVVDATLRTADPYIYAIGDCARVPREGHPRPLRLESVPNAIEQGRALGAILTGKAPPATAAPWFWSDQFDLKLQMVGLSEGFDRAVVRGNPEDRSFAVFYFQDDKLLAMDAVNRPQEFMVGKRLVGSNLTPRPQDLADESLELRTLVTE